MPPKKAPKVKKPRLGRAGRAAPERKKSQKLKQIQKVNVQVTSGGGGGGSTAPAPFIPQQFRDTSGENVQLLNLVKSVSDSLARGNILGKAPVFAAPEVAPNPANDSATTTAVFNAPITYNDTIPEQILREEDNLPSQGKRRKKKPIIILEEQLDMPEPISIMEDIKKKRGPQKGVKYGSTKEKYKQVGFQEGVPAGRNIQNEMVMAVEQMRDRAILPGQMRLVPTEDMMENAPAQSTSSAELNFA
jgi:hypothetical protein